MNPQFPDASGIYRITCTITGKFYIGSSTNLQERLYNHLNQLHRNDHRNDHLQRAWNKYGEESFIFEVIELVLPAFLLEREQYWLDTLKPFGERGFNLAKSAQSPYLGMKHSAESIKKISATHMGHSVSQETRNRLRSFRLGKKHNPQTIAKMKETRKGRPISNKVHVAFEKSRAERMRTLIVTDPDGVEYIAHGVRPFAREHGLDHGSLFRVAQGKYSSYKGWKARFSDSDLG